jgi:hypothetical protein
VKSWSRVTGWLEGQAILSVQITADVVQGILNRLIFERTVMYSAGRSRRKAFLATTSQSRPNLPFDDLYFP